MSFFKGSTEFPDAEKPPLPEEEMAVLKKVAKQVVDRRMAVPAIVFLESVKPLNYIGSQALVFFEPIVQTVFNFKDYNTLRSALEKRESIETMILEIEALDAVSYAREKRIKKFMKKEKKNWKWYQRYLGLFKPKVQIPDEVINPPDRKDSTGK
ncbi:MAG: hypothetical protein ABIJ12_00165 [bacterium]